MKHYLIVVPTDEMGGAEGVLRTLAIHLQRKGSEVHVICLTRKSAHLGWDAFKGKMTYFNTGNVYLGLMKLFLFRFSHSFDRVIASQVYINGVLGILRRWNRLQTKSLVLRESTSVFLRFKGLKKWSFVPFYKLGYPSSDLIIHQSELMKSQLLSHLKFTRKFNHVVLGNPIDLESVRALSEVESEIPNFPYIIGVGRLIPAKGFDLALKAFASISNQFPNMHYVILGEGSGRQALEELARDLNLQDKVHMLGFKSNPYPYMKHASLCVMSSRIEGYPNVLLQMLALNGRIVSTLCAGGIEDLPLQFRVEIDDSEALANACTNALLTAPLEKKEVEKELRSRSVDEYLDQVDQHAQSLPRIS